jgi:predicted ATPase
VIVGENGSGKSHLLKVLYALIAASAQEGARPLIDDQARTSTKTGLQRVFADKLMGVLRPESLDRLARRKPGRERCELTVEFAAASFKTAISFATSSKTEVKVDHLPAAWQDKAPVFIPAREVLSQYHGLPQLYRTTHVDIEENLIDLCDLLGALALKGAREKTIAKLVAPLEYAMGGKVLLDKNGRFYLVTTSGNMEMPLLAEGLRKLAMVARLISTGSLLDKGYLFWDEPESNLNPKLIKVVAALLLDLSQHGIQVMVATHSFFLLKELDMLSRQRTQPVRYMGLFEGEEGTEVQQV